MSVCTPAQAEIPDEPDGEPNGNLDGEPSGDPEIPEGYCRVFSLDGETYDIPQPSGSRQLPVEDIIKKDDNGKLIVYITLQDGKGLAVSTTDPDKSVSSEYVDGTVALGQDMKVLLDFPALLEPALGGIQEDVWYYLDLPDELVPQEEEGALNQLIDPTDPMELLQAAKSAPLAEYTQTVTATGCCSALLIPQTRLAFRHRSSTLSKSVRSLSTATLITM